MFERYTEKARRVIFFARYEASQFGSPYIESEHLLLGLLREDKALTNRFLRSHSSVELIRKQIEERTLVREKVSTSVDLPLSDDCKRVLAYAAEEAERLGHKHIGTEHLLLGLLREERCFAAELLKERGIKLEAVREELAKVPPESAPGRPLEVDVSPTQQFQDLTQAAIDGMLEPVVGRSLELDAVIEVLAGGRSRNPLLVGERGAGKSAIVEALAQRIADGAAPPFLAEKRIMVFEPSTIAASIKGRIEFINQLNESLAALVEAGNAILFFGDLHSIFARGPISSQSLAGGILKSALAEGKIQCIAACSPNEFKEAAEAVHWIDDRFRPVHVRPLSEDDTLAVLKARRAQLEKLHDVTLDEEALEAAAKSSSRYLPDRVLPGKAIELLDAAAAHLKLRAANPPEEIVEVQKRIRFIVHRMDSAIANHEFEKARFYSDEEKKERENLRVLREKHHLGEAGAGVVGREEVEAIIACWSEYPFQP